MPLPVQVPNEAVRANLKTLSIWTNGHDFIGGLDGYVTDVLDGVHQPMGKKTRKYCMYIVVEDLEVQDAAEIRNCMHRVRMDNFLSADSLSVAKSLSNDSPYKPATIMKKAEVLEALPDRFHKIALEVSDIEKLEPK